MGKAEAAGGGTDTKRNALETRWLKRYDAIVRWKLKGHARQDSPSSLSSS